MNESDKEEIKDRNPCDHCHDDDKKPRSKWQFTTAQALRACTPASGLLLVSGFLWQFTPEKAGMSDFFYILSILVGGVFVLKSAINGLIKKRFLNISFLVTIAAIGALYIGEYGEAAAVVFLFSLSEFFETFGIERSRQAVEALLKRSPKVARLKTGETVEIENVSIGTIVVVKPGEQIPLDGMIVVGASSLDEATITGESNPVDKEVGAKVFAGTLNIQGYLEIQVTKVSSDSLFSRIITLIEKAQNARADTDTFIETFARYYTPLVVVISFLVATVPTLAFDLPFEVWLYRAITLLVIACPCALVISTPVAIASAIGGASRSGILIKGGSYLERLASVQAIAFDKTRTLTHGRHTVTDVLVFGSHTEAEVIADATGIEYFSSHPLAQSIIDYAIAKGITPHTMDNFENIAGKGGCADCTICSAPHAIGNRKLMDSLGVESTAVEAEIKDLESSGKTVVFVASHTELIGAIAIADEVREEARSVIAELEKLGVKTSMLTGDNAASAAYIGGLVGVSDTYAALSPEDKVKEIATLQAKYGTVAMVGDGINDAPSLATADVGFAIGAGGTDVAIETADIALMSGNLSTVPQAIRLARRTMRVIKVNIALALGIKVLFLFLVVTGNANLVLAIAADSGMALVVIVNSLRLFSLR